MLFELDNLTKNYGQVTALRGLTVRVPDGAIGLLGPNGAGKTTLIRSLLGLITLDSGSGQVLGLDIHTQRMIVRQAVGFMPEDECLFPYVAGVEFVAYAGELTGMGRSDALQRSHEVLNYVGLGEARYRKADSYSTGMKQRLKLAAAIVHDPKFVILDEPTNGLDPAGRREMIDLARDLSHGKGMSLLFSSHLLPDVEAVCDHVMVMGRGRLLSQGKIAELKQLQNEAYEVRIKGPISKFTEQLQRRGCRSKSQDGMLIVTLPEGAKPDLLWQVARETGEQIRHLRSRRGSLEDVFMKALREGE